MTQSSFDPFPAADLETNRAGRLGDDQRKGFGNLDRAIRKNDFTLAIVFAVLAALLLTATGPAPNSWARPIAGGGFAVVAVFLLFRAATLGDSLIQDLRSGRVEPVEGALGKRILNTGGRSTGTFYYFDVAGKSFEVGSATYHAAPEAGIVRLYVLPRSHKVVNLERLPDRPLPEGVTASPTEALGAIATAFRSHDRVQAAEARAELEAIKDKVTAERAALATPPPTDQRDPRPLAEAILGTWQTGPISMTFMPDGTVVAMMGPRQQHGRWSVGPDGRLHSDAMGRDQTADAWVAGDTLSISEDGQAMAFRRAAGN